MIAKQPEVVIRQELAKLADSETIAIILCSSKDYEMVELMDLEQDGIHVAEQWLQLPPKEVLQAKLHRAIAQARVRIGYQGEL